jgi:hypothetical protein
MRTMLRVKLGSHSFAVKIDVRWTRKVAQYWLLVLYILVNEGLKGCERH